MSGKTEERREAFAASVARALESDVVPWARPGLPSTAPRSAVSDRQYTGLNAMYLLERMGAEGFSDPRWITYKDAQSQALDVRAGERGVSLEHWEKGRDGKLRVYGYRVFNVQQLSVRLPFEPLSPDFEKADGILRRAGAGTPSKRSPEAYQDAFRTLSEERANRLAEVHTPELRALRASIAASTLLREVGIAAERDPDAPTKQWAQSIRRNPREFFRATRDAGHIVAELVAEREAQRARDEARGDRETVQKARAVIESTAPIPRGGADHNLPDVDLDNVQENVMAALDEAATEVKVLHGAAAEKESAASEAKSKALGAAKAVLGPRVLVTDAQAGRSYRGKIIAMTDTHAIQRISENQAVLHEIGSMAREAALEVGSDVSVTLHRNGSSTVKARSEERAEQERQNEREARR